MTENSPKNGCFTTSDNFMNRTSVASSVGIVLTSLTLGIGSSAGCSPEQGRPVPEQNAHSLTNATLPVAPKAMPNEAVVGLFLNPRVPSSVKQALLNPGTHDILHRIVTSDENGQPFSYNRHLHQQYGGKDTIIVIQHLLNESRDIAIKRGNDFAKKLDIDAGSVALPVHAKRLRDEAKALREYVKHAPKPVALDGDYGARSHSVRAFTTMVENWVTKYEVRFNHQKEDRGANDTAIGPQTFKRIFFRADPAIGAALLGDFEALQLAHKEAGRRKEPRATAEHPR